MRIKNSRTPTLNAVSSYELRMKNMRLRSKS